MAAATPPEVMHPRSYRLRRSARETPDTFTLTLEPEEGVETRFRPGQFGMLWVFGVGELPISISGDPEEHDRLEVTVRSVGQATNALVNRSVGDAIGVRSPLGVGWPVEAARGRDVILVAGGIGLAPLRPALYEVVSHRDRYGRVVLLYGARTPDDILFRKQLKEWRGDFDLEVHVTVDRATGEWRGNVGVVTTLIPRVPFDPYHTVAMVCGPEVMMRFTVLELERRGVPTDRIWLSLERNMKCGVGLCGHCQCGPKFICRDGAVFPCRDVMHLMSRREL